MAISAPSTAPVIPLHPPKADQPGAAPPPADRRSERKWGKAVIDVGYTIVPSVLLRAPRRLGLSPTQLAIVLVLAEYWWEPGKNPWPSKADLCNRIGLKPRQLQRHIAEMEQAGLISRKQRFVAGRKTTNEYDLSGLVQKLKALAPEFQEAKRAAKARQELVSVPAGRRPSTKTPA
jgi:DNA-binding MarR family transcriptional regulator